MKDITATDINGGTTTRAPAPTVSMPARSTSKMFLFFYSSPALMATNLRKHRDDQPTPSVVTTNPPVPPPHVLRPRCPLSKPISIIFISLLFLTRPSALVLCCIIAHHLSIRNPPHAFTSAQSPRHGLSHLNARYAISHPYHSLNVNASPSLLLAVRTIPSCLNRYQASPSRSHHPHPPASTPSGPHFEHNSLFHNHYGATPSRL